MISIGSASACELTRQSVSVWSRECKSSATMLLPRTRFAEQVVQWIDEDLESRDDRTMGQRQ